MKHILLFTLCLSTAAALTSCQSNNAPKITAAEASADAMLALNVGLEYESLAANGYKLTADDYAANGYKLTADDYAAIVQHAVDGYAVAHPNDANAANVQLWTGVAAKALKLYQANKASKPTAFRFHQDLPAICATDPAEPVGYALRQSDHWRIAFTTLADNKPSQLPYTWGTGSDESSSGSNSNRP